MTVLVTGAAGFIGFHVSRALLARGERVIGVDNLNDYYDVRLKEARLDQLAAGPGFAFLRLDIAEEAAIAALAGREPAIDRIVHLAAQAGVLYSLTNPGAYIRDNIQGHYVLLELCRRLDRFRHFVYASSSSVYGGNRKLPFSIADRVDEPVSLYAATKRSDELISHTYSHLFRIPATGLRFFTVYGPWGRPDMAMFIFTKAILAGEPIRLFNYGNMRRDFTYIDDVVAGVLAVLERPPPEGDAAPHRLYNLGHHRAEELRHLVELIERATGRKAIVELAAMPPGDVPETFADIEASARDFGFAPRTPLEEGVPRFVDWYRDYHGL